MCIHCHPRDDRIIAMLQSAVASPQFTYWNMTSLHHVLLAVEGYNGEEAHRIALQLIEQFYEWAVQQPTLRFGFPDTGRIRNHIDSAKERYQSKRCTSIEYEECTTVE
jgi:hypothetical protein